MELHSNKLNTFKEEFHKLRGTFQGSNSLTKYNLPVAFILELLLLWTIYWKNGFLLFLQVVHEKESSGCLIAKLPKDVI